MPSCFFGFTFLLAPAKPHPGIGKGIWDGASLRKADRLRYYHGWIGETSVTEKKLPEQSKTCEAATGIVRINC